jgi:2-oxoglutarate ferredoxin oxidoreductase subunit beta
VCELLSQVEGVAYLARHALTSPPRIRAARKAILRAFQAQLDKAGFALVELLSTCPTFWRMPPRDCIDHIETAMVAHYPLGEFVNWRAESSGES